MTNLTKTQANRIAYFGAIKMDAKGYRYEKIDERTYGVETPEGNFYTVGVGTEGAWCGCKFWEESGHGVCKHTMKVRWMIQADEQRRAEEDADADRQEALAVANAEYLDALERYHYR